MEVRCVSETDSRVRGFGDSLEATPPAVSVCRNKKAAQTGGLEFKKSVAKDCGSHWRSKIL
jgi:hypothetical protein